MRIEKDKGAGPVQIDMLRQPVKSPCVIVLNVNGQSVCLCNRGSDSREHHCHAEPGCSTVHRAPWSLGFLASGVRNSTSEMQVSRNCVPRCTPLITSLILFTGFV